MIGIVVVSHSPQLAKAAVELALEMVPGERPRLAIAAGVYDGSLGTDATAIAAAIGEVASPDGVLVVVDLGSAVLSAELALELIDLPGVEVRVTSAPFVEGLMAGVVRAAAGATLDEVEREARESLESKRGHLGDPADSPIVVPESGEFSLDLRLRNPSGLHIRPASMIVLALTPLDATVTIANLRTGSGPRLANSPTKLLTLAAQKGDVVRVTASGAEAQAALDLVRGMVADGFGELDDAPPELPAGGPTRSGPLGVSPGRAVGPVARMPEPLAAPTAAAPLPEFDRPAAAARIDTAAQAVGERLRSRAERVTGDSRQILEAAALLAVDPSMLADARTAVLDRGDSPEFAVWVVLGDLATTFALQGGRMAERVADLADIRNRIVAELLGREAPGVPVRTEPFVLVGRDLAPADTALLDPAVCLAIVTLEGGPTSHTAILSRSLGLPALVSYENALDLEDGTVVLVDGTAGNLIINPSAEQVAEVRANASVVVDFGGIGATSDGHRVQLLANVGSPDSVAAAIAAAAEGIGLFRTEFLFLDRAEAPSVDEQVAAYRSVFESFAGKRVLIRTLDAGADKPLAFVTLANEANPALGIRGYRTTWRRPELLDDQLRAIALAAEGQSAIVQVMAPMIDTPDEAADFAHRCAQHGLGSVGVMIETPAAAITAPEILAFVDFASLGTNDLAQYTMAADREVGDLALLNDPWQPAVLRMMRLAFDAGAAAGKPVSVCGEAAADPMLAAVLVGFGASSLSMSPRALGHVSELLDGVTLDECRAAAVGAASSRNSQEARTAAASALRIGS
ncbi:MAG: multiphosphoryl transfer protein [Actinomycetota bacterium]|nr:multiphosphoryl transfer protein [Actinomycetota bacterium]